MGGRRRDRALRWLALLFVLLVAGGFLMRLSLYGSSSAITASDPRHQARHVVTTKQPEQPLRRQPEVYQSGGSDSVFGAGSDAWPPQEPSLRYEPSIHRAVLEQAAQDVSPDSELAAMWGIIPTPAIMPAEAATIPAIRVEAPSVAGKHLTGQTGATPVPTHGIMEESRGNLSTISWRDTFSPSQKAASPPNRNHNPNRNPNPKFPNPNPKLTLSSLIGRLIR